MTEINNSEELLDVRDIIDRVEQLSDERAEYIENDKSAGITRPNDAEGWETDDPQDAEELDTLESLLSELCGYGGDHQWEGDWYPVTLIRDSYFEDAMDDLLEDCGYLKPYGERPSFIKISIDYDALQMDYSSVEYDGVTYWYR